MLNVAGLQILMDPLIHYEYKINRVQRNSATVF